MDFIAEGRRKKEEGRGNKCFLPLTTSTTVEVYVKYDRAFSEKRRDFLGKEMKPQRQKDRKEDEICPREKRGGDHGKGERWK